MRAFYRPLPTAPAIDTARFTTAGRLPSAIMPSSISIIDNQYNINSRTSSAQTVDVLASWKMWMFSVEASRDDDDDDDDDDDVALSILEHLM
jgi:hypothetical protein